MAAWTVLAYDLTACVTSWWPLGNKEYYYLAADIIGCSDHPSLEKAWDCEMQKAGLYPTAWCTEYWGVGGGAGEAAGQYRLQARQNTQDVSKN